MLNWYKKYVAVEILSLFYSSFITLIVFLFWVGIFSIMKVYFKIMFLMFGFIPIFSQFEIGIPYILRLEFLYHESLVSYRLPRLCSIGTLSTGNRLSKAFKILEFTTHWFTRIDLELRTTRRVRTTNNRECNIDRVTTFCGLFCALWKSWLCSNALI